MHRIQAQLGPSAQAAGEEPAEEPEPEPMDEPAEMGDTAVVEWGSRETGSITISDVESTTKPYDQYACRAPEP